MPAVSKQTQFLIFLIALTKGYKHLKSRLSNPFTINWYPDKVKVLNAKETELYNRSALTNISFIVLSI